MRAVLVFVAALATRAAGDDAAVSPITKVIAMMSEMQKKAQIEKQEEVVVFAKFEQFCHDTATNKQRSIEDAGLQIDLLGAQFQKYDSDAVVLSQEVQSLDAATDEAEKDHKAAADVRKQQKADYSAAHTDYVESIDDLVVAINRVRKMMHSMPGAAASSLIQTEVSKFVDSALKKNRGKALGAFLQASVNFGADGLEVSAPEASVFESQSGGITDMMDKLQEKMEDEKMDLEREEVNAQSSYEMMSQSLTGQITQMGKSRGQKVSEMKDKESKSAQLKGEHGDTSHAMAEDQKYLSDLTQTCQMKTADFESHQKVRAEEIAALDKAIEIIGGGAVAGAGDKHLPSLVQVKKQSHSALVQLRSNYNTQAKALQSAAASFLQAQGRRIGSHILVQMASKLNDDPFNKVRKMIKDMVIKLMEEANDEAEHKGWCDTELTTNKQTRDTKSTEVGELTASIEQMTADAQKLASEVAELSQQVGELDTAVAEATSVRQEEKEKNSATVTDAKGAIVAVSQAHAVLQEFYSKNAISLIQVQTRGEGGILGMLEVILSDFERLETETSESEATAARQYQNFMAESSEDKAVKQTEIRHKKNHRTKLDGDATTAKRDMHNVNEELSAAMDYYEKLKPSCVDAGSSYDDRVQRRKDEIESLKQAMAILDGSSV